MEQRGAGGGEEILNYTIYIQKPLGDKNIPCTCSTIQSAFNPLPRLPVSAFNTLPRLPVSAFNPLPRLPVFYNQSISNCSIFIDTLDEHVVVIVLNIKVVDYISPCLLPSSIRDMSPSCSTNSPKSSPSDNTM